MICRPIWDKYILEDSILRALSTTFWGSLLLSKMSDVNLSTSFEFGMSQGTLCLISFSTTVSVVLVQKSTWLIEQPIFNTHKLIIQTDRSYFGKNITLSMLTLNLIQHCFVYLKTLGHGASHELEVWSIDALTATRRS